MAEPGSPEVTIRPATGDDVPALTALYNHYIETTAATFDLKPWTIERRRDEWFSRYAATGPYRLFVAQQGEQIVGMSYSGPWNPKAAYDTSVETSVYCLDGETGRGLGRALVGALLEALEQERVHRAFALITLPNEPSERLIERMGFSRRWHPARSGPQVRPILGRRHLAASGWATQPRLLSSQARPKALRCEEDSGLSASDPLSPRSAGGDVTE